MSIYQMFVSSFFHFKQLFTVRKTPFGKVLFYLVLLSFLFAIPMTTQVMNIFGALREDGQKIAEKLPAFTIDQDQLVSPEENSGFIYQSNYLTFTFDPDGKRTPADIQSDLKGKFISIGMLQDELIISLPSDDTTQSLLGDNAFKMSYNQSVPSSINGHTLKKTLSQKHLPWFLYIVIFLVAIYPSFINLVFTVLLTSLFASIWAKMIDRSFSFLDAFKTVIVCSTLPTLLSTFILFFDFSFNSGTFIFLATSFLFYQTLKKNQLLPSSN